MKYRMVSLFLIGHLANHCFNYSAYLNSLPPPPTPSITVGHETNKSLPQLFTDPPEVPEDAISLKLADSDNQTQQHAFVEPSPPPRPPIATATDDTVILAVFPTSLQASPPTKATNDDALPPPPGFENSSTDHGGVVISPPRAFADHPEPLLPGVEPPATMVVVPAPNVPTLIRRSTSKRPSLLCEKENRERRGYSQPQRDMTRRIRPQCSCFVFTLSICRLVH